jgi:hypothetical protein
MKLETRECIKAMIGGALVGVGFGCVFWFVGLKIENVIWPCPEYDQCTPTAAWNHPDCARCYK